MNQMQNNKMTSTKPYIIKAFYSWIIDNNCTPYILVNAEFDRVVVPQQYVENGQIVLNISMSATHNLELDNDFVSFSARFAGIAHNVFIPIESVLAIYAKENGRGMIFSDDENHETEIGSDSDSDGDEDKKGGGNTENNKTLSSSSTNKGKKPKGKPNLTVVK